MGIGLKNNSPSDLTAGFKNLKSHYKFLGIVSIIFMSLYPIGIIAIIVATSLK
jgi:hypothetical protein